MFDFRLIVESIPLLVKGAVYTVQVSVLAIVFGLVLGWMLGLVAVSGVRWLRAIAWGYVQFIRGTPLLVQIFLIYFGLPNRYRALFSVWRRPSGEPEPAPAS